MRYSGLIYAAIVACWAAVLVPRWIRRNEEIEHAREEDAARGVRVLDRDQRVARAGHAGMRLGHATTHLRDRSADEPADVPTGETREHEPVRAPTEFSLAARRRSRVVIFLLLALAGAAAGAASGVVPVGWPIGVGALLVVFLVLGRRAAIAETRRRARARHVARMRAAHAGADRQAADGSGSTDQDAADRPRRRIAVLDEPPASEPIDPDAWEPVPVPLPTYLTKAKAATPITRKIDLSSQGAWTSGRLNPASSIAMPPPSKQAHPASEPEDAELPEHRRAVGD